MINQAQFANFQWKKLISSSVTPLRNAKIQKIQRRKRPVVISDAELPSTEED